MSTWTRLCKQDKDGLYLCPMGDSCNQLSRKKPSQQTNTYRHKDAKEVGRHLKANHKEEALLIIEKHRSSFEPTTNAEACRRYRQTHPDKTVRYIQPKSKKYTENKVKEKICQEKARKTEDDFYAVNPIAYIPKSLFGLLGMSILKFQLLTIGYHAPPFDFQRHRFREFRKEMDDLISAGALNEIPQVDLRDYIKAQYDLIQTIDDFVKDNNLYYDEKMEKKITNPF